MVDTARRDLRLGLGADAASIGAAVLDPGGAMVAWASEPLGADVAADVERVAAVLGGAVLDRVAAVMVATDSAERALRRREGLLRVGVLRVGGPSARTLPPLRGWPADLLEAVSHHALVVDGGHELGGRRTAPLDVDAARAFVAEVADAVDAFAVCAVFAPTSPADELAIEGVINEVVDAAPVSLSHRFGTIGLLERENATVLNAALSAVVPAIVSDITAAMRASGVDTPLYVVQNDGSLMSPEYAVRRPILTVNSGPASAMRGAVGLTGVGDGVVAEIGGGQGRVGTVAGGAPREARARSHIAGIPTNVRMPHLVAMPLPEQADERWEALSGVADTLTWGRRDVPLICVGSGAADPPKALPSGRPVITPAHSSVARAFGAARAAISGRVDRLLPLLSTTREQAERHIRELAEVEAVMAGAEPGHVEVDAVQAVPLTYVADPVVRLRATASGPVNLPGLAQHDAQRPT